MKAYKQTVYDQLAFTPDDCCGAIIGVGHYEPRVQPGVHRVVILTSEANLSNLQDVYGQLLGGHWNNLGLLDDGTVKASWNLEAGVELVSPVAPGYLADLLNEHGEGLLTVIFNVKDLDQVAARATELGLKQYRRTSLPGFESSAWSDPHDPLAKMPLLKKAVADCRINRYEQITYLPDPSCGMSLGIVCCQTQS
jgi:hypothetical protein